MKKLLTCLLLLGLVCTLNITVAGCGKKEETKDTKGTASPSK